MFKYYLVGINIMEHLVMEIKDYNSINEANIEINKINVVGGVNGSGKSTVSRIFYSFLKGNSIKRRDYAIQGIAEDVNVIIDQLDYDGNEYALPDHLEMDDDPSDFMNKYKSMLEISKRHDELAKTKAVELKREIEERINHLAKRLENNGFDVNKEFSKNEKEYGYGISDLTTKIFSLTFIIEENNLEDDFNEDLEKIIDLDYEYQYYSSTDNVHFMCSLNNSIMNMLFVEDGWKLSKVSYIDILSKEHIKLDGIDFDFYVELNDTKYNAYSYFFKKGFIESAYYVDNVSIIDIMGSEKSVKQSFHMEEIIGDLFEKRDFNHSSEDESSECLQIILEKIEDIIKGSYNKHRAIFEADKIDTNDSLFNRFMMERYNSESNVRTYNFDTPSGIKQIGIIQLLLLNNKLKENGYLIIDEPEVNLHPDWQFRFAEILVLLAKDLNITIYINSHSPFFIEAIDAFTQFYDMENDINYYLTEESENEGKYDFTKISSDELYRLYNNLGEAYRLIDQLRIRKRLDK